MAKKKPAFLKEITLNWWQAGLFKSAAVSFGILLGLHFQDFFITLTNLLWVVFIGSSIYILSLWSKQ